MSDLSRIIARPVTPISDALRQMDEAGDRILLVAEADCRLLGVVTDGDIRRWIISGKGLKPPASG